MGAIRLGNVCFDYIKGEGEITHALVDVSLEIEEGSFVAVLGANGSGKSTFAKLLNALVEPLSGVVEIFGKDTKEQDNLFFVRSTVGMVFQNPDNQMVATLVEDEIAFGPENIGVEPGEIAERVDWALKAVNMQEHYGGTPYKMSGGQKQRIAIAGALALRPKILVLDESTSMLDPLGRSGVMEVVKRLNKQDGVTIIFITHDMSEAVEADRVIVFSEGRVVLDGTTRDIFLRDDLEDYSLKLPLYAVLADKLGVGKGVLGFDELIEKVIGTGESAESMACSDEPLEEVDGL